MNAEIAAMMLTLAELWLCKLSIVPLYLVQYAWSYAVIPLIVYPASLP